MSLICLQKNECTLFSWICNICLIEGSVLVSRQMHVTFTFFFVFIFLSQHCCVSLTYDTKLFQNYYVCIINICIKYKIVSMIFFCFLFFERCVLGSDSSSTFSVWLFSFWSDVKRESEIKRKKKWRVR